MADDTLQEKLEALNLRSLRIVAKKLKIRNFKTRGKADLVQTILGAMDEAAIRKAAALTWWDIHQNQVYGFGSLALSLIGVILALFFGLKGNSNVPGQIANPVSPAPILSTPTLETTILAAPSLISPSSGSTGVSTVPTFSWSTVTGANYYWLIVADNLSKLPANPNATAAPGAVIGSSGIGIPATSYTPASGVLSPGTTYYWEVQAYHGIDASRPDRQAQYSIQASFTTAAILPATTETPPVASLSFTSLTPGTVSTSQSTYVATLSAGGTNFNNVNQIITSWSGPDTGSQTRNRGDSNWNATVTVNSNTSMTLLITVLLNETGTQIKTWNWTVTLRDTNGATASRSFMVTYMPSTSGQITVGISVRWKQRPRSEPITAQFLSHPWRLV